MPRATGVKSEERLIPVIRAKLAEKLAMEGFRVKDIATSLNVTQAAVTQYLKRRRGADAQRVANIDGLIDPLVEKLAVRIRSGLGGIETVDLLEAARQVMVMNAGSTVRQRVQPRQGEPRRNESLELLRRRLQLELKAAEKYLELANKSSDDYTKLLLRMIASDSIKHGYVVSQIISWLEAGNESGFELPSQALLESMLSIEDSANEESLRKSIDVGHPVARILLEWIDTDEAKHGKMVSRILSLSKRQSQTRPVT
jgi:predicted transcriptional regulator